MTTSLPLIIWSNFGNISIIGSVVFLVIFAAILYSLYKYLIARRNQRIGDMIDNLSGEKGSAMQHADIPDPCVRKTNAYVPKTYAAKRNPYGKNPFGKSCISTGYDRII